MCVLFLITFPTLKACNSPYIHIISNSFCFAFLGSYIFIPDQNVKAKSSRNRNCIFHSFGNPKSRTLDHFFYASHIRHNFPYKLIDTYIDELVEIFLKLSMKTIQVHLIIGTTSDRFLTATLGKSPYAIRASKISESS